MAVVTAGVSATSPSPAAVAPPVPPPGSTIFCVDGHGRACRPGEAYM
jgi:hypothetical protein